MWWNVIAPTFPKVMDPNRLFKVHQRVTLEDTFVKDKDTKKINVSKFPTCKFFLGHTALTRVIVVVVVKRDYYYLQSTGVRVSVRSKHQ